MVTRWHAWQGTRSILRGSDGRRVTAWTIVPVAPFKGGADTEFEVQAYLDAMTDRARGLAPEFPGDPQYMAGWRGDPSYARGIIDAVQGGPPESRNEQYLAGYNYQPRPRGHGGGNKATPRTYSGPRF